MWNISLLIFLMAFLGFIFNHQNTILYFITIEMMLVGCSLNLALTLLYLNDSTGLLFILIILIIAGIESAIGLTILVLHFRINHTINLEEW